ncbi:conserved Plasmodium protein, unknown function [Plasmodium gallinaceum]|uniref:Poly(A) RNA polymerase mitochondrial-like central palm domain-containing protein n=1 Tax=Plasmodium gallinaceum TaxID=5849 RepID=A0A1J1GP76_PLAGA|nr:conserved Plasmodium protein, unknown function [Plasmodium gallinaceum]CRG94213.1 conserved Plasmodium protein, unknown function [Plasmodium gallinaceum]
MNVKKFSMFSYILRKKLKIHISSLYYPLNNLLNYNLIFRLKYPFFHEYSTSSKQARENNRKYEVDKKINLTNCKVTDTFYISSDDSDEEYILEKKLKKDESLVNYEFEKDHIKKINNENLDDKYHIKNNIIHINKEENVNIYNNNADHSYSRECSGNNDDLNKIDINNVDPSNISLNNKRKVDKKYDIKSAHERMVDPNSNNLDFMKKNDMNFHDQIKDYQEIKNYLNIYINENHKVYCPNENKVNALNEELKKLEISLKPSQNDINNMKKFLYFLQNEINKYYKNCYVTPFGSIINGFWMRNSDIDICIQVPILLNRKDQIKLLRKICLILNNFNDGVIEQRFSAKVPIIHFYCKNPQNSFELSCDISINNILAVINSKLIQKYVSIDKRLQVMGIALKYWSKNRNINDRSKGFLSSFSLILMIIHFLQNAIEPKILPSLQDISSKRNEKPFYVMGVDCKYCQDEKIIREELNKINNFNNSYADVSTLLTEFFKFYGYKYKSGIIAIRDINDYYENFHALKDFESYFLFVDNPFEVGKNVANVMPKNYKTIVNEMKRAYRILKNNGSWRDVCNPSDNLIYP